jgi:hypothetical protein
MEYKIIYTEAEDMAMKSISYSVDTWIQNVCHERASKAIDAIVERSLSKFFQAGIQIPSSKAEPFKLWLAKVGAERLEEIENPEIGAQRTRELFKLKGYPDDWIEKRMRSIAIREELTDEWKNHGIKEQIEFSILTAEISKATFGITPSDHKKLKNIKSQNLRDHMSDLELIFSMLGEASTTEIVKKKNPLGFIENKKAAIQGGKIAGDARKALELKSGEKVVSKTNFLPPNKNNKTLKAKNKK